MDFPGRIVAGILAVIMLVLMPLQYVARSAEEDIDSQVGNATEQLSDTIRNTGYLDTKTYEDYIGFLDSTGELYNVKMEDIHPITGEEISVYEDKTSTNTIINTLSLSPEKEEIQSFSTHTHTADCYRGHDHIASGCQLGYRCCNGAPIVPGELYGNTSEMLVGFYWKCSNCGKEVARITHSGSTRMYQLQALRYDYWCGGQIMMETIRAYDERYGSGDILVKNLFDRVFGKFNTIINPIRTYDALYSTFPELNLSANIYFYNGYIVNQSSQRFDPNAIYSCKPANCTGNTVTLISEKVYPLFTGKEYPRIVLAEYYCGSCGKQIVHAYAQSFYYGCAKSPFIIEGSNAWSLCEGVIPSLKVDSVTYGYDNFVPGNYDFQNGTNDRTDVIMGYFKSRLTDPSLTVSLFDNTGYVNNSFYIDYGVTGTDYRVRLIPSGASSITHYLLPDSIPRCNEVVTSISASSPNQTIKKGESIITTATANYLDGHTAVVNCTSDFNPNISGTQTVTLTYTGVVGNARTTGTRTCSMSVTVISKTLTSITASPSIQTMNRGGTPVYSVTAYYSDGTSAVLTVGSFSVSAYDNSTAGSKTITITYSENGVSRTTTITVLVDDILSISISPLKLAVERYTDAAALPVTVIASYLYSGSKPVTGYTVNSYSPFVLGEQTITFTYTENGTTVSATIPVTVTVLHKTCPRCGRSYDLTVEDIDQGCPFCKNTMTGISVTPDEVEIIKGDSLPITVCAAYQDGTTGNVTGWTSNYKSDVIGLQFVTVSYGGFEAAINVIVKEPELTCPNCKTNYPASERSCPVCREKVVSLKAMPESITVNQYDILELEVYATYADGSIWPVTDWSINCTTAEAGIFTPTITYKDAITQITLIVRSLSSLTCPSCGLDYDSGEYPGGCPVCSKTISEIEAYLSTGSNLVQYGTLPNVSVVLVFRDMHREVAVDGYTIEGYHPNTLGPQKITVRFREFFCTMNLEVVDNVKSVVCPEGHVYYLNEDGSDPGCPYCVAGASVAVVYYYDITYTAQILDEMYTTGSYSFDQDNYLTLCITKKGKSLLTALQKYSFKTVMLGRRKRFYYGGKVL